MEREGFRAALPEQLRSHIEDAEQTPLIEFRLDGSTTVSVMELGKIYSKPHSRR
jgi:hypothetical protein